jgi:hypothetical protein
MHKGNDCYKQQIQSYINECHFDIGVSSSKTFVIDEAQLAKMLTRIVVSTATLITTTLSLKQYAKEIYIHHKRNKIC